MKAIARPHAANTAALVDGVIRSRRAIRAFLPDPVSKGTLRDIFDVARSAPSNSNLQPWRVYAVAGAVKESLSRAICQEHDARPDDHAPGYKHMPDVLCEKYETRRKEFGRHYYGILGIDPADTAARHRQVGRNFLFFGAPVGFVYTIDETLERGSWLDFGMFIQSVMIAAQARGLDTCPQVVFSKYHRVIREQLSIPAGEIVVCGMSMGYADRAAGVNRLEMPRDGVDDFASFLGFES